MRILGIDPGSTIVGYGLIEAKGGGVSPLSYGVIKTRSKDTHERLQEVYGDLRALVQEFQPDVMAVEQLFFFKNAKTVITVGQTRGVILLAAMHEKVPVAEYTPLQVKMGTVGYGRAEKSEIGEMVKMILNLEKVPRPDDAADGLAIALCHANFIDALALEKTK